ncbi:hypothetical protein PENTCL1PPCAC_13853, partial [Pristionchus entomophagus]
MPVSILTHQLSTGAPYGLALFSHTVLFWPEHLRLAMNLLLVVLFMEHFILLSFHFLYRYLALCNPSLLHLHSGKCAVVFILVNFLFCGITAKSFSDIWCYSKSETYFVEQLRTEYNLDILAVPQPGYFSVNFKKFRNNQLVWNWPVLRAIVAVTIPAAFSIVVCFVCIFLILRCFSTNTLKVRFRHLQIQLFHALLFQFSVPMVLVCLPFTLSIGLPLIGLNIGQFAKVLSLAFEFYPAIDPFIVIIVVPRFRRIIIEKLLGLYGQKWRHNEIRERTRLAHYLELIMGRDTTSVADIRKRSERAL